MLSVRWYTRIWQPPELKDEQSPVTSPPRTYRVLHDGCPSCHQPIVSKHSFTHSLLCLTSEGHSDLHNERSCANDHSESIVHLRSSSTCCIQVFFGRPGGRFQSGAGHLLCERLMQCRMLWAGTSGGRRQTCPSNECLLSAMMRGRSVSFVWFRMESLA